jgi:hypothetical protein
MFETAVPEASFHRAIAGCRPELIAPRAGSNPGYSEILRNRRSKNESFRGFAAAVKKQHVRSWRGEGVKREMQALLPRGYRIP